MMQAMKTLLAGAFVGVVAWPAGALGPSGCGGAVVPSDQGGHPDASVQDGSSGSGGSSGSSGSSSGGGSGGSSGSSGSSSGGGSGGSSGSSSGGGSGGSSGSGSGGGSGSSSGSSSGGVDAGCGAPPSLHQSPAGTIFCAFLPDAGVVDCTTGQECCVGGEIAPGQFAPQECAAFAGPCTNGSADAGIGPIPIECNQLSDCAANGLSSTACCLQNAKVSIVAGCGYSRLSDGSGVVCEGTGGGGVTACAAGEIQICSAQSDCPTGTTCVAAKWKLFQVGVCQ